MRLPANRSLAPLPSACDCTQHQLQP